MVMVLVTSICRRRDRGLWELRTVGSLWTGNVTNDNGASIITVGYTLDLCVYYEENGSNTIGIKSTIWATYQCPDTVRNLGLETPQVRYEPHEGCVAEESNVD